MRAEAAWTCQQVRFQKLLADSEARGEVKLSSSFAAAQRTLQDCQSPRWWEPLLWPACSFTAFATSRLKSHFKLEDANESCESFPGLDSLNWVTKRPATLSLARGPIIHLIYCKDQAWAGKKGHCSSWCPAPILDQESKYPTRAHPTGRKMMGCRIRLG